MIRLGLYSQDAKLQPLLASALGREFEVIVEPDGERIKELVAQNRCEVLILDLDSSYCSIAQRIQVFEDIADFRIATVALIDDEARPVAVELVQRGLYSYFRKPPALRELKIGLRRAYEHSAWKRETQPARPPLEQTVNCDRLIGASAPMRSVYDLVRRVASLNASVLITGESGTGKELVARAIHNLGNRSNRPFIAVSCGAIPETLIEAELFGHEKGAFTGTVGAREGYLEQAANGTLFLDEIGELSLHTQVKLLRVLQQKEFSRLGSNRLIPLHARVIFATHRDLTQMVEDGTFRRDLFYRVNVMRINCPALVDHVEDIPLLAHHFLRHYSEQYQKPVHTIQVSAMTLLQEYGWPGNVRELENVIQGAIILTDNDSIGPHDLPEHLRQPVLAMGGLQASSFEKLLHEFKVKLATKAIEECNGNKTLAARSLNISRAYLHRLIRLSEDECDVA
ncbi:MAG TPA: sigma-54 dependent transcriptional regulator [Bryobacteraceae bacterium]|nr:sigma-54 dependent transcriptional regulator [Bryobacteraceae bacterium]